MIPPVSTFIAMGGGGAPEVWLALWKAAIEATGKRHPQVLSIPTDGGEDESYWPGYQARMTELGCSAERLFLLTDRPTRAETEHLIAAADMVFVGGGNTLRMMRMWRRFGVDRMLVEASKRDVVLSGVSAGAICWFQYGHSDSRSFSGKLVWPYIRVAGLGLLPGTFCPHVLGENRLDNFRAMMARKGGVGYGVDDGAALHVRDGVAKPIGKKGGVVRVVGSDVEQVGGEFPLGWPVQATSTRLP